MVKVINGNKALLNKRGKGKPVKSNDDIWKYIKDYMEITNSSIKELETSVDALRDSVDCIRKFNSLSLNVSYLLKF